MSTLKNLESMLVSIITYNWNGKDNGEQLVKNNPKYLKQYIDKFGLTTVETLADDIINDLDHIETDVYTDSEGLTYNSVVWKDGRCHEH